MALKKSVAIEVEARTEGAVQNIEKLATSTKRANEATASLDDRLKKFDKASNGVGLNLPKTTSAMGKADTAARTLAVGLEQSKSGTLGMAQVATTAAAAFGPLGLAISVVGGSLLALADSQMKAATAADEHTEAIKRQKRIAKDKAEQDAREESSERYRQAQDKDYWDARHGEIEARREELEGIQDALAQFGSGKDMSAFLARKAEIEIANLRSLRDDEGAAAATRAEQLRVLAEKGDVEPSSAGRGKPPTTKPTANNDFADKAAIQEWDALMDAREDQRLERKRSSDLEFKTMDERFNLIVEEQAAKAEAEEKRRHEESLARIAEQQAAEEQLVARREELLGITAELANRGVELGNMVAHAAGVSAKKREKIANILGAAEAFTIGTLEVIKAAAAAAAYNWPQFALHTVAAAIAFTKGGMMSAAAGGGGVGVGGGAVTGSSLGGGSEPAANERPSTSNTQKDTTPVSESGLQQSGSTNSGSPSGSGKSFNFAPGSISVIGAIDDQSATKIAQGIRRAEQNAGKLAS